MSLTSSEHEICQLIRKSSEEMEALLAELVSVNSHTPNLEGVNAVGVWWSST